MATQRRPGKRISVALCTFNGARFLAAQLDSIASQSYLPSELVACDDGSSDHTFSVLKDFASRAPFPVRICLNEKRLGVVANFHKSLEMCSGDLFAFSDQDDIWLPHKLEAAETAIRESLEPLSTLYCSRLKYVNAALEEIAISAVPAQLGFQNAIAENVATGCSVVFGAEIRRRFLAAAPGNMVMHDWWVYLVASAYGTVFYDPVPGVLYRQHGQNVTGWEAKPKKLWNRALWLVQRLRAGRQGMDSLNQAERFLASYPDLPIKYRREVESLLKLRGESLNARLRYLSRGSYIQRNDPVENLALKMLLLMGWH